MSKKTGLPDFMRMKHDIHFVDEIARRAKIPIIRNIPIEKVQPNDFQPRKDIGDLNELTDSIKENGIIEPIIVRPKNGNFEIVAGERRYRAAMLAGLKEVPCIEHDIPDNEALEISIVENIQRKELAFFEEAYALKSFAEIYGYTHEEIAKKLGKSRVTISELIRITDLPIDIQTKCQELKIQSKTFLLELVKIEDKEKMKNILEDFSKNSFSREKIKAKRKGEKSLKEKKEAIHKIGKIQVISDNKLVKLNIKIKKEAKKEELIFFLEKLIEDLKTEKIIF